MRSFDIIVLGAGVVGVSTALYLRKMGMSVALVDRRDPGEETSFGNSGIIQREGVHPYLFARSAAKLLGYAFNRMPEARWRLASLPAVAPFLWRYFLASNPRQARRTLDANLPLFAQCLTTHGELVEQAGCGGLIARKGWISVRRRASISAAQQSELADLSEIGLDAAEIGVEELARLEPDIDMLHIAGAIHYRDPWTVSDPGKLVKAYAKLFASVGGRIVHGNAETVRRDAGRWHLDNSGVGLAADQIVVALGPWSKRFLDSFGVKLPMGLKRGYHRHFRPVGKARLRRPIFDSDSGYVLAPMTAGIRLTTGAEFAALDALPNPDQIDQCLAIARRSFPVGEPVEPTAWMGARPVMPECCR